MATNAKSVRRFDDQELRDLIVRRIVELGCVCAPDLVAHVKAEVDTDDMIRVLEAMVGDGVLQHKHDPKDPRKYTKPYQVVYELAS